MVLAFALGFLATLIKSDLKLPEGLYTSLSIYLLFAIGLKGGAELSVTPVSQLWAPALGTLVVSLVTAWIAYIASRKLGKLDKANAASFAAHYGSVSAVTFIAAESFATLQGLKFEGFMPALVALLEIPAILFALAYLGRAKDGAKVGVVVRELFTGKTIVLLVGGVLIGVLTGKEGMAQVLSLIHIWCNLFLATSLRAPSPSSCWRWVWWRPAGWTNSRPTPCLSVSLRPLCPW